MIFETSMNHEHLLAMLCLPDKFERAVIKYTATKPRKSSEGMAGYIEIDKVTFELSSLKEFTELWYDTWDWKKHRDYIKTYFKD